MTTTYPYVLPTLPATASWREVELHAAWLASPGGLSGRVDPELLAFYRAQPAAGRGGP
jgi:hypothetical protein